MSLLASPLMATTCPITNFGAVGDGRTDNRAAIQNAFNYAASNHCIALIPDGEFAYSNTLTAKGIAIQGLGAGSKLLSTNVYNEALILTGNDVSAYNFTMASPATKRLTTTQSGMILAENATNYSITNILIVGSASNGIMSFNSSGGTIADNTIKNTLADSITQVVGSHDITVKGNKILNAGDDGISTVSYVVNPVVYNVKVTGNNVRNNLWGRGMSVVGGNNITFTGNYVDNPDKFSDLYIASESEWNTRGVDGVTVSGNVFNHGGPDQGALIVYNSQGKRYNIANVNIANNQFDNPLWIAVQLVGNGAESGVSLDANTAYSKNGTFVAADDSSANYSQSNNRVFPPTTYPGQSFGGCNFSGC